MLAKRVIPCLDVAAGECILTAALAEPASTSPARVSTLARMSRNASSSAPSPS